jgi:hypothetical protein
VENRDTYAASPTGRSGVDPGAFISPRATSVWNFSVGSNDPGVDLGETCAFAEIDAVGYIRAGQNMAGVATGGW